MLALRPQSGCDTEHSSELRAGNRRPADRLAPSLVPQQSRGPRQPAVLTEGRAPRSPGSVSVWEGHERLLALSQGSG